MNTQLLLLINGWAGKNNLLDGIMVVCASNLIYLVFGVATVLLGIAAYQRRWQQMMLFLANLVIAYGLLQIVSKLYIDHRPFVDYRLTQLVPHAAGKSFASDHTTAAFAIGLGVLVFLRQRKLGIALLVLAALIGFARIFTGIHYPVDIVGGVGVAITACFTTYLIGRFLSRQTPHGV